MSPGRSFSEHSTGTLRQLEKFRTNRRISMKSFLCDELFSGLECVRRKRNEKREY